MAGVGGDVAQPGGPADGGQRQPLTDQVDFLRASRNDLIELRRQVQPLARRLATRLTAKRRLGRNGKLDFRRTVRASLATGGVPLDIKHKPNKPHKPELVVFCDVSGSVSSFVNVDQVMSPLQGVREGNWAAISDCGVNHGHSVCRHRDSIWLEHRDTQMGAF